jgi:hypothetical protein
MSGLNDTGPYRSQPSQLESGLPATYLDLIEKVGGIGKYQYMLACLVAAVWYVTGIILMSTSFMFLNPDFDCEAFGLLTPDCYDTVCALPREQWPLFVTE